MCFVKIFPLIDFLWLDLFYQTAFNSSLSHKSALSCFFKAQTNLNLKFIRIQYTASTLDFPWAPLADGLLQDEVFIISVCTSAFKSESMCGERKLLGELWKATQRIQTKYCHSQYSKTWAESQSFFIWQVNENTDTGNRNATCTSFTVLSKAIYGAFKVHNLLTKCLFCVTEVWNARPTDFFIEPA